MLNIATALLLLVAIGSIAFGFRYLFAKEYLSYHAQLTGLAWAEIPEKYQSVILGMLKIVAAGMLVFGIALIWLLVPLRRGESWSSWALLSLVCTHGFISIYVTIALRSVNPKAQTNVAAASIGVILGLAALVIVQFS